MDVLSGGSIASDGIYAAAHCDCLSACSHGFQGFETKDAMLRAVEDVLLKNAGLVVRLGAPFGLLAGVMLVFLSLASWWTHRLPFSVWAM